jgi:flagellar hook-associated protein 1 FlgK
MAGGVDITAEVRTGSLGGLLAVRDQAIPGYRTDLDTLAYGVADAVNTLHATGYDLSQAAGGSFFVPLGTAAGAAALLQVDPALAADTSRIAAAGIPSSGDNAVARQLADLRDAPVIGGRTPSAAWAGLVYRVGSDVHQATRERESRREIVHQVETLRDSVSGVSIDEEAALMMRFQRAYEANARFFTVVDEVLQTLLSLKR